MTNQLRSHLGHRVNDPVVGGLVSTIQQMEIDRAVLVRQLDNLNARVHSSHDCDNCCLTRILCKNFGCCMSTNKGITYQVIDQ